MININNITEITRDILISLGIEVQKGSNILFYQNSKSPIFFEDHPVKANINNDTALFINKDDVRFNPVDPKCTKLMERFFARYLDDAVEEENLPVCSTYFFDKNKDDGRYKLNIRFEDGTNFEGNWYINKIICFIEDIFNLDGTFADTDLYQYDINQSEWEIDE